MNVPIKSILPALAVFLSFAASAQSNDVAYCTALSEEYARYLGKNQGWGVEPQSLDAQVAVQKCAA